MTMQPQSERETGIVVTWRTWDRYGFLQRDADPGGEHAFVHQNAVSSDRPLTPGTRVSYVVTQGPKGLRASSVETL
jgi:cold shock CspA family protein